MAEFTSFLFLNVNLSTFFPSRIFIFELIKAFSFVLNNIFKVQNSSGTKTSISCSLSVNNFKATD